jgi:hypothetical protein
MLAALRSPRPRDLGAAGLMGLAVIAAAYVAVQGVAGFGGWLRFGPGGDPVGEALAAVVAAAPQLAGLEAVAPEVSDRLMRVIARDVDLGLDEARIVADTLEEFGAWRAEALPEAPDRVVTAYLELAIDRLHELKTSNPSACAAMTLGVPIDDATPYLGAQHLQREMNADRMLLRAGADEPVSRMTGAEAQAISREIEVGLRLAYGASAALLDAGQPTTPVDDVIVCRMGIAMMEAVAALGPDRGAAAARSLFFAR